MGIMQDRQVALELVRMLREENGRLEQRVAELEEIITELDLIVSKLNKTKDGVPVVPVPTTRLWYVHPGSGEIYERDYRADLDDERSHWIGDRPGSRHQRVWIGVKDCFSTREAVEKAMQG